MINWLFDKLGYMPKITVDFNFPATPKEFYEHEIKKTKKPAIKKVVAKKTVKKKA